MRLRHWIYVGVVGVVGLVVGGCAGTHGGLKSETRAAVAPTGTLQVAFITAPIYATKDAASGEFRGVAVDLGRELASRLGVPFSPVAFPNPPALISGASSAAWDVALMGVSAERAQAMDFTAPFMEVEQGFLVRSGTAISAATEIDRPGVRVGVLEKSGADGYLSGTLKVASLIRVKSLPDNYAALDSGQVDVIAATKQALYDGAASRPGSRVLDGRFLVEPIAMGVPKGRDAAVAAWVGKFVEDIKKTGHVKTAIEAAKLRGVVALAQ